MKLCLVGDKGGDSPFAFIGEMTERVERMWEQVRWSGEGVRHGTLRLLHWVWKAERGIAGHKVSNRLHHATVYLALLVGAPAPFDGNTKANAYTATSITVDRL